ncbi:MAG: hypothetical protein IJ565_03375 [Bacilli bacterium]|nr:hypothetical protein [Bacilli bacterium]
MEKRDFRLIKPQQSKQILISPLLEKKIRFLCNKFPSNEWSGALFTITEGDTIYANDLFLMNIGDATYTEWEFDKDLLKYKTAHYFDADMNIIHSHHQMNTFFSGTDMETLYELGIKNRSFVSLIVNNAGTYSAYYTESGEVEEYIQEKYKVFHPDGTSSINTVDCTNKRPYLAIYKCHIVYSNMEQEEWEKELYDRVCQLHNKVPKEKSEYKDQDLFKPYYDILNELPNELY